MKKIGIVTFHRAINYGAMLQAVALQKAVCNLGYNAELIDYVDRLYEHYKPVYSTGNPIKSVLKYFLSGNVRKRNNLFERFLADNAKVSETQYTSQNIHDLDEMGYAAFISGSDQTFNPHIVDYDDNYVLGFVNDNDKCNAYAASIGLTELTDKDKQWLITNVSRYHCILAREKTAIKTFNEIGINGIKLVCDPTFLLSADEWKKMQESIDVPKHYILYYGFKKNELMDKKVKELSQKSGYPVYIISDKIKKDERGYKKFSGIGPAQWLYLIEHADYIVTNSFHGMIFSFIFNKQVWIADSNDGTFSRIKDFLENMKCGNRILEENAKTNCNAIIPYDRVNEYMKAYVDESRDILGEMLRKYYE